MADRRKKGKKQGSVTTVFVAIVVLFTAAIYIRQTFTNKNAEKAKYSQNTESPTSKETIKPNTGSELIIDYIDVGQGNSTLITSKDVNILIDGGERGNGERVEAALDKYGIDTLDYVIATHPHTDHIGGITDVMYDVVKGEYKLTIKNLVMSDLDDSVVPTTKTYSYFLDDADKIGTNIIIPEQKQNYTFGSVSVSIIPSPYKDDENLNNESLIAIVTHGENKFVFTGDAEAKEEKALVSGGAFDSVKKSSVYLAGHHGSSTGTTNELLDKINPEYGVISCGEGNMYGHPHVETLQKFSERNIKVLRTDLMGSIEFKSDGKNLQYKTEK